MTDPEKIKTEESLAALGRGYFGICALGGVIWIVLAMSDSLAPALCLSLGVGLLLSGGVAYYLIQLLIGMSHSLRTIAEQTRK